MGLTTKWWSDHSTSAADWWSGRARGSCHLGDHQVLVLTLAIAITITLTLTLALIIALTTHPQHSLSTLTLVLTVRWEGSASFDRVRHTAEGLALRCGGS